MKERGRYQIQFMKTRSSSGVGQKVDLEFNLDTLRITDLGEEESEPSFKEQQATSVINNLKRTSVVTTASGGSDDVDPTAGIGFRKPIAKASAQAPLIRSMMTKLNPEKD
jgi:hypothetical protein